MINIKNGWYPETGRLRHYVNDSYHNEKVPASIYFNGSKFWCQNNKAHRLDGPAAECNGGAKYWYYQGKEIKCKSQQEFERIIKLRLLW